MLPTIFWLTSWVRSGLISLTLLDLLALEDTHPSLVADIDTVVWQIQLIKQQLKDETDG